MLLPLSGQYDLRRSRQRRRIEDVIDQLIAQNQFETIFKRLSSEKAQIIY